MKSLSFGLQQIERLLWATALLAIVAYTGAKFVPVLYQSYGEWSFARAAGGQRFSSILFVGYLLGNPEAQPAPPVIPVKAPGLQPLATTPWMARLEFPRLNYNVMVREGTDRITLGLGAGHIEGTALPGRAGNVGLAGHRDTFFRQLSEVKVGDAVRLRTLTEDYSYTITSIDIVAPLENHVLAQTEKPSLTLVTCYPFWGLGSASKRYIVRAVQVP